MPISTSSSTRSRARTHRSAPILVGTGFLALDLLYLNEARSAEHRYAGGSCGNVLSILAYLGWKSYPVARLAAKRDAWTSALLSDLQRWDVHTDFIVHQKTGITPAIIVRVRRGPDGKRSSRFEWRHPRSNDLLPRYRPLPLGVAEEISPKLPAARVFYFDRPEKSALLLANKMRDDGATIFFEPSGMGADPAVFAGCLQAADIVKYSAQRLPHLPTVKGNAPKIEIQTLGEAGLRFRVRGERSRVPSAWRTLSAIPSRDVIDPTGCGDWCSAGIIHQLCHSGHDAFLRDVKHWKDGLRFGQALATINCRFEGARGPMYELSPTAVIDEAMQLVSPS